MKLDRRTRFYLLFAGIGFALSVFYFFFFQIPLNYSSLQDVFMLSLYTMAWGFVILGFFSMLGVLVLTRVFARSEKELAARGLRNFFSLPISLIMAASLGVLIYSGNFGYAFLSALILLEIWLWLSGRGRPKAGNN